MPAGEGRGARAHRRAAGAAARPRLAAAAQHCYYDPVATELRTRHPRGLYVLFFAEMWERFSFYGMRALLIFYMTRHFVFGDEPAYAVYGSYTALVYATPAFGGLLADRLLGFRKAVIVGAVLMALGHFAMAVDHIQVFYLALALLICGNGFFKPNISTIVGRLYGKDDPRRDGGFTIFSIWSRPVGPCMWILAYPSRK